MEVPKVKVVGTETNTYFWNPKPFILKKRLVPGLPEQNGTEKMYAKVKGPSTPMTTP